MMNYATGKITAGLIGVVTGCFGLYMLMTTLYLLISGTAGSGAASLFEHLFFFLLAGNGLYFTIVSYLFLFKASERVIKHQCVVLSLILLGLFPTIIKQLTGDGHTRANEILLYALTVLVVYCFYKLCLKHLLMAFNSEEKKNGRRGCS